MWISAYRAWADGLGSLGHSALDDQQRSGCFNQLFLGAVTRGDHRRRIGRLGHLFCWLPSCDGKQPQRRLSKFGPASTGERDTAIHCDMHMSDTGTDWKLQRLSSLSVYVTIMFGAAAGA